VLQGTGLAVYTAETALRNYLTTGGSLFSAPGESPDSYRTVSTFLMIVSGSRSLVLLLDISLLLATTSLPICSTAVAYVSETQELSFQWVDRATLLWQLPIIASIQSSLASVLHVVACCSRC
jgi:hypothetical protein